MLVLSCLADDVYWSFFRPKKSTMFKHHILHPKLPCEVHVTLWKICIYFRAAKVRLALTVTSYSTSLNAKRNAAVSTLWVTFGPIPDQSKSVKINEDVKLTYLRIDRQSLLLSISSSNFVSYPLSDHPYLQHASYSWPWYRDMWCWSQATCPTRPNKRSRLA